MIIYFSGSGNSLYVAKQLAELTQDSLIHLNEAIYTNLNQENIIGLVYPTYSYDAPLKIKETLDRLNISANAYVYIITTCGSTPGNSIHTVKEYLAKKQISVCYSRIISMPDSSAIALGRDANDQYGKLMSVNRQLQQIADDVMQRRNSLKHATRTFTGTFVNSRFFFPFATYMVKQAVNPNKCVGCGICAKVCPNNNISIKEDKAHIHDHCTQCLACVHSCPHQAMEIRHRTTDKKLQYRHPKVSLRDMYRNG